MNNRRKQLMLASAKEYCKCVVEGKTLKYNQIVKNGNFNGTSEWSSSSGTFSASDNICSFDATAQNGDIRTIVYYDIVVGHKYLVYAEIKTTTATSNGVALYFGYSSPDRIGYVPSNTEWNKVCGIKEATAQGNSYLVFIRDFRASDRDTIYIKNVMCIDLAKLGLDTITNTSDFFETDLGKYVAKGNYLPYEQNGKFIHAQSPINFEGVNIWNEKWENGIWYHGTKIESSGYANYICCQTKIKVRPNTQYFYHCGTNRTNDYIQLEYLDKDSNYISREIKNNNSSFTTPINCYYIVFYINDTYGGTYHYDICISENIWDENYEIGYIDGNGNFHSGEGIDRVCSKGLIKLENGTYTTTKTVYVCVYDKNGNFIEEQDTWNANTTRKFGGTTYIKITGTTTETTYDNDIAIFYYGYHKYCSNSVFESGLTLYKGDKYKTYSIDEINYNNAITNAQQDSVNSVTDTKDYLELNVYDLTNCEYIYANQITQNGFYEYIFTAPYGSNNCCINHGGAVENIYFAQNVTIVAGHKYYLSLNVVSCNPSFVGGLRIANLRLIDLTELGLTDLTDKLRIFLQKNYKLPYTMTNKTIKDQIVRTGKEIDLSTLTWESSSPGYRAETPNDIKLSGNTYFLLFEKYILGYVENQMVLNGKVYIQILDATSSPTGKMLYELETPEIITDYPMDFVLSNDNLDYDSSIFGNNGTIFNLPNGLIPVLENGIPKLEIIGDEAGFVGIEYGNTPYPAKADVYFVNGFRMSENQIAFTTTNNDGSNVNNYDEREFLVGKTLRVWVTTPRDIPDIMISRRTIKVESENEIDLDFTKE